MEGVLLGYGLAYTTGETLMTIFNEQLIEAPKEYTIMDWQSSTLVTEGEFMRIAAIKEAIYAVNYEKKWLSLTIKTYQELKGN